LSHHCSMTTHVNDCSNQTYLFVCRLYFASVWIATGQSIAVKEQAVRKCSLVSLAVVRCMFNCQQATYCRYIHPYCWAKCVTDMCRKSTAEKNRQGLQQYNPKGTLKGSMLQVLVLRNQRSKVCGTCQINQKEQPGKKNVKVKLST